MARPIRIGAIARVPEDVDQEWPTCPVALTRTPWVSAVLDLRAKANHAPLTALVDPVRPALVEALQVVDRTAQLLREDEREREKTRAATAQKLAAFARR